MGEEIARWPKWIRSVGLHLLRIRYRLLLVNILIVAVPLVGIGFARFYEGEMLRGLEKDMIHQAQLLREVILNDPEGLRLSERSPVLVRAARHTRTRIRLLSDAGLVVADSHSSGPPEGPEATPPASLEAPSNPKQSRENGTPDNITGRPEIIAAARGNYGSATRLWESQNRVYLFSAIPMIQNNKVLGIIYVTRSTTPVKFAMFRLRATLLQILIGAICATVVLSLFLAGTISRPLVQLITASRRISEGSRTEDLRLSRRDEIGDLARTIDKMARNLDKRAQYATELAANVSHEFKSPLTSIRGAAELLLDGASNDLNARRRFLKNIIEDSKRLDRLVSGLLALSRMEYDVQCVETFDYEAAVREAALRNRGAASITIRYNCSAKYLQGRKTHLQTILDNLLDNAQQHAAPNSSIRLHVSDGPQKTIRTSVTNIGQPITETNLKRVWDRFFTTRAKNGGTGLGLAIVKTVVEAHGGSVDASSSKCGETIFSYLLQAS